jgi:3-hydroxyisobutyrate dehydrogenase-like beta-hydroxyacid dehydrogenase
MKPSIVFIGLGSMGRAMARRLVEAGHPLQVYNRTRRRAEELAAAGVAVLDHPSDLLAAGGDSIVVFTMLADDAAVEQVTFGEHGFAARLPPGSVHVSCSTISVELSRRLAEAHTRAGQGFLAAPVLGRPEAASAGKLFILAAGEPAVLERCQPLLAVLGQRTFPLGAEPPLANTAKLACNFLIAAMIENLAEAIALTAKSGLAPHAFVDLLTASIFDAPAYKTYGKLIADDSFAPAGFKLPLGLKDLRLVLRAADDSLVTMPTASLVHEHMVAAMAQGQQDLDWSSLARIVARNSGLPRGAGKP